MIYKHFKIAKRKKSDKTVRQEKGNQSTYYYQYTIEDLNEAYLNFIEKTFASIPECIFYIDAFLDGKEYQEKINLNTNL